MTLTSLPVEYLGSLTFTRLPESVRIIGGPTGDRNIVTVTDAQLIGPKINASMPKGVAGGDWATLHEDGTGSLDCRLCFRTDDGADIFVSYLGYMADGALKITPRFETGDERYAWLNTAFVVGIMDIANGPPGYQLYIV